MSPFLTNKTSRSARNRVLTSNQEQENTFKMFLGEEVGWTWVGIKINHWFNQCQLVR